jgi:hypothetical protein
VRSESLRCSIVEGVAGALGLVACGSSHDSLSVSPLTVAAACSRLCSSSVILISIVRVLVVDLKVICSVSGIHPDRF